MQEPKKMVSNASPPVGSTRPSTVISKRKIEDLPSPPPPSTSVPTPAPPSISSVASPPPAVPEAKVDQTSISPLKKMFPLRKRFKSDLSNEDNPYASPSVASITSVSAPSPSLASPSSTESKFQAPKSNSIPKKNKQDKKSTESSNEGDAFTFLPPRKAKLAVYNILDDGDKTKKENEGEVKNGETSQSEKKEVKREKTPQERKAAAEKRAIDRKLDKLSKPGKKRKPVSEAPDKGKKKRIVRSRVVNSDDEQSEDESESSAESSEEESESEEEPDDGKLYCLCKKPYDKWDFMIACDSCDDWFHVRCVGLTQAAAKRLKQYICPICKKEGAQPKQAKPVKSSAKRAAGSTKRSSNNPKSRSGKSAKSDSPEPGSPSEAGSKAKPKCLNKSCNAPAKPPSKYCSSKCGVTVALENLKKKEELEKEKEKEKEKEQNAKREEESGNALEDLSRELNQHIQSVRQSIEANGSDSLYTTSGSASNAEIEDVNALQDSATKKKEVEKGLISLAKRVEELDQAIKNASLLFLETSSSSKDQSGQSRADTRDTVDCPSCGKPVGVASLAKHLDQCNARKERTKSAVSNKNRLCGYPTNPSEKGYCTLSKEGCSKHIGWEELRKAELVQEKNQLLERLGAINSEEQILKLRISRRRQASTSEQHRTIVEFNHSAQSSSTKSHTTPSSDTTPVSPTTTNVTTPPSATADILPPPAEVNANANVNPNSTPTAEVSS
eukprot:TRINITY_DN16315_c0_g1_i1.p1 TRINITY_DN16315_c0_g1~~TRINITY_DN16315_c0_g1_i1.p1  ORF type:complete len:726 (+),score=177.19 TRINITY_DN16315_c0_g1_i1:307-2484(+)